MLRVNASIVLMLTTVDISYAAGELGRNAMKVNKITFIDASRTRLSWVRFLLTLISRHLHGSNEESHKMP